MPGFETPYDFQSFANAVRQERRFFHSGVVKSFLSAVVETAKVRAVTMPTGKRLWRAQIGYREWHRSDDEGHEWTEEAPFAPDRMKPHLTNPPEGRANPRGIAYLYLATDSETAIAEVRPWSGALVSVGQFEVVRGVKLAAFIGHEGHAGYFDVLFGIPTDRWDKLTAKEIEEAVWADIDSAFSRPVGPQDERIDYVPTQIIAELFRDNGFDGIAYKSALSEKGYNVVLFDLDLADLKACHLFNISNATYSYEKRGSPWVVKDGSYVTSVVTYVSPSDRRTSAPKKSDKQ